MKHMIPVIAISAVALTAGALYYNEMREREKLQAQLDTLAAANAETRARVLDYLAARQKSVAKNMMPRDPKIGTASPAGLA